MDNNIQKEVLGNNSVNNKKKIFSSLKSIPSVPSDDNCIHPIKTNRTKTDDRIETVINEIHLVKSSNTNSIQGYSELEDDDKLDEEGEKLISKLKEGIKETKTNRNFALLSSVNQKTTSSNNFLTRVSFDSEKMKNNKYEQYNTENIAYKAYNKYSKCRPKEGNFLDRMKFYAIKKQSKIEAINIIVDKSKKKIKEKERISTFNRLIEDSNRRAEAKNRIIQINGNKAMATEIFERKNNLIHPKKKKFDQQKWEQKYKTQVELKLKERQKSLDILRKQKEFEKKEEEDKIVQEMKKYKRTASNEQISLISERLYNEGRKHRVKSVSNLRANNFGFSKVSSSTDTEVLTKQNSPRRKIKQNYFQKFSFQGYKNTWNKSKNGNLSLKKSITDIKGYNHSNKKKYVSSTNAEKLIDSFFLKNKKCF